LLKRTNTRKTADIIHLFDAHRSFAVHARQLTL